MVKKFTSKPIKSSARTTVGKTGLSAINAEENYADNNIAEEKFEDFYKDNGAPLIKKPRVNPAIWGLVVLVAILCGFGSAIFYDFLFNDNMQMSGGQKVVIEKQENITVSSEQRLKEIADNINPVVVNFYDNSDKAGGPYYQDTHSFGSGFILTSDGWIVTTVKVMDKIGDKDFIILTADYHVYKADSVLKDPISPAVFIKITASNLPVAKLGKVSEAVSGQLVYGFIADFPKSKIASLHLADLQASNLSDVVASSEKFSHFISVREGYDPSLRGAPMVNLSGEIMAIVLDTKYALPTEYLIPIMGGIIKNDIKRPELGVNYINLAKYPKVNPKTGEMRDHGALLSGYKNLLAVKRGSPADKAGLQVGDIILQVEDELVNGKKTLTQMIQEYSPGSELELLILRGEKERVVKVVLGKIE